MLNALISPDISIVSEQSIVEASPLKLGVMASGSGTNFEAVVQAIAKGELNAEIKVLIYNNPQAKVKQRAEKFNIPAVLIDHRNYQKREALDQEIVKVLQAHGVDWVIMAGWMRIITSVLLRAYPDRVINIQDLPEPIKLIQRLVFAYCCRCHCDCHKNHRRQHYHHRDCRHHHHPHYSDEERARRDHYKKYHKRDRDYHDEPWHCHHYGEWKGRVWHCYLHAEGSCDCFHHEIELLTLPMLNNSSVTFYEEDGKTIGEICLQPEQVDLSGLYHHYHGRHHHEHTDRHGNR